MTDLEQKLCNNCGVPVVDEGNEVYTHEDGEAACNEELWAQACEDAGDASPSEYYEGTYAEWELPCPEDPDGQHHVGCGCDA